MVFTAYDAMFYPPLKNVYRSIADMAKQRCSNALDIGSGTGTICRMMRDKGINAIGNRHTVENDKKCDEERWRIYPRQRIQPSIQG